MIELIELMNNKLKEIQETGDKLYDIGYLTNKTIVKLENPILINTKKPELQLLFSIIPLIFIESSRKSIGSYSGKHVIEQLLDNKYISNGEFILVMLCLGYKMKTCNNSPNVLFYGNWSKTINMELKHKFIF
jgi:hypothetical protein